MKEEIIYLEKLNHEENCVKCKATIHKGSPAYWDKNNPNNNWHIDCYDGPVASPKPIIPIAKPEPIIVSEKESSQVQEPTNMFAKTAGFLKKLSQKKEIITMPINKEIEMPKTQDEEEIGIKETPAQEPTSQQAAKPRGRPPKAKEESGESITETPAPKATVTDEQKTREQIRMNLEATKNLVILPVNDWATTPLEDGLLCTPYDVTPKTIGVALKLSPSAMRKLKSVLNAINI